MKSTNNTILITGGGSGIGRALAERFHALGNEVIISGRTQKTLDEVTEAFPGIKSLVVDMTDRASIKAFAHELMSQLPTLNVVIHNAGIMRPEKLLDPTAGYLADAEAIIATNLLGPIYLTSALLPHLQKQPDATVMTVSSGLAFVPMAPTPTYCATKAAIHSYSQSLRYQLRETTVKVVELIPPYVATTLMGSHQAEDPQAMPLEDFIKEVMHLIETQPDADEINVQRVLPLRLAAEGGREKYEDFFTGFNDQIAASMAQH